MYSTKIPEPVPVVEEKPAGSETLVSDTFDKIFAKLDSAQRKHTMGFGKDQSKPAAKEIEPVPEVPEEAEELEFKKPVSGRSSRSMKKAAPKTPIRPESEEDFLL
jgi:hypothetical protein